MAITYPLALPTTVKPAQIQIYASDVVAMSLSPFTMQQQVQAHQGSLWRADITLPPMDRNEGDPWKAFLLALGGRLGTFTMGDPRGTAPRGIATGTPLVKGAGQTGQSLITDGWTINITGILKAGDYLQIGSYLYVNLNDANSNGTGDATLDIWPRLRSSPSDNAAITVKSAKGLWRLTSNERSWLLGPGTNLYRGITFGAMEAI